RGSMSSSGTTMPVLLPVAVTVVSNSTLAAIAAASLSSQAAFSPVPPRASKYCSAELDCPVLAGEGGPMAGQAAPPAGGTRPAAPAAPVAGAGRSARKRQAIMAAATASFLRDGYHNTSMAQVAADAAVSK